VRSLTFLPLILLPSLLLAGPEHAPPPKPLAIVHVTVIDATGAAAQPELTVVITGHRISALGKTGTVQLPRDAQPVDASGQFLIPGLWDMHVHWNDAAYLPLFTANGVTGIRVMWGLPLHLKWRRELAAGTLQGPRLVLAGPVVDGPKPFWKGSIAAGTEGEGQQAVRKTKDEGYDFVKIYNFLPRRVYFAIADEAKKQGLPFVGHVPNSVSAAEASDAGQKSIEHLQGMLLACSAKEEELRKAMAVARTTPAAADRALLFRRISEQLLEPCDARKAAALFARFRANGTWHVPTFTVLRSNAYLDDPNHTSDPRLKFMPPAVRELWNPRNDFRFDNVTPEDFALEKKLFQRRLELAGDMHRAGVGLLAGTDVLNPYCFPGFSLHDELEWLVKAGLSPMAALQTATRNPARFLDQLNDFGTVEQGKVADLVLLDADPLQDIKNTRRIAAVVAGGRLLDRKTLQKMLADAGGAANKK